METFISTITVPLEKYDAMVKELETLREEVKKKVIVKYEPHWKQEAAGLLVFAVVIFGIIISFYH